MQRDLCSRRSVLSLTTGLAVAGVGTAAVQAGADDTDEGDLTRDSFPILEGTKQETTVYVTTAPVNGPTVVVIGGVHGNEVAGYAAAGEIADWIIDAGTLVTIPEANAVAVERDTRVGADGDLNRQFPVGDEPGTDLARAIWDVLTEYDPAIVVDVHESRGIYATDPVDGVGQAIFHSQRGGATSLARDAAASVTRNDVDDADMAFQTATLSGPETDPTGLLVHKAARDLDADAFLVETLSTGVDLENRISWHTAIVEQLVADALFPETESETGHAPDGDPDEPDHETGSDNDLDEPDEGDDVDEREEADDAPGDDIDGADDAEDESDTDRDGDDRRDATDRTSPVAEIRTTPERAAETTLEPGTTVELDASCSSVPDGDIVASEWCVHDDDVYDETGNSIEVTVSASGDHPVELRVVDDADSTDTAAIVLTVA